MVFGCFLGYRCVSFVWLPVVSAEAASFLALRMKAPA
jgi:hypothetical protein